MAMKLKSFFNLAGAIGKLSYLHHLGNDLSVSTKSNLHVRYYNKTPNVGDDLNLLLMSTIQSRCVYVQKSGILPHVLGIGSILHFATKKSHVWGSGFISDSQKPSDRVLSAMKIFALRGEHTKELLVSLNPDALRCPLGDPGILMPEIYSPTNISKKYRLGIVPHVADCGSPWVSAFEKMEDVRIIKLDQNPLLFINKISECDYIASSSLHGLILSDAYSIPNTRLRLSNKILGGDFKFLDYYSTTSGLGRVTSVDLRDKDCRRACDVAKQIIDSAIISSYLYDRSQLLSALLSACDLV